MKPHTQGNKGFQRCWRPSLFALATLVATIAAGCEQESPPSEIPRSTSADAELATGTAPAPAIRQFCGDCHALPSPSSFPKDLWHEEVQRGFNFYYSSNRTDLEVPPQSLVSSWYRENAPEEFRIPSPKLAAHPSISFHQRNVTVQDAKRGGLTGVSFLTADPVRSDVIWCSDMLTGAIRQLTLDGNVLREYLDVCQNPVSLRFVDLDKNQKLDLLIADLGSELPADHDRGQVVWIPNCEESSAAKILLKGKGRIADVQPGDFDQDGDLDLIVAEFGWHKTGGIHFLKNESLVDGNITWSSEQLDSRPGTIHTPVIDLNQDGRLDFVALISQEHEVIEYFMNTGSGFEKKRLFSAPDPSWGSSGIEPVDFDRDGDTDILYTNGDTFDSKLIKPYHSIRLLRNDGQLQFKEEKIADLPGVHRALTFDPDNDGDLDIVACALLPSDIVGAPDRTLLSSVIWLEQTSSGSYRQHAIQTGQPGHAAMLIHQPDAESPLEVVVGCFSDSGPPKGTLLQVFRREITKDSPPPQAAPGQ